MVLAWLSKLFGKRCIETIHGIGWQRAKWGGFTRRYIRFGEKVAAKDSDEINVYPMSFSGWNFEV